MTKNLYNYIAHTLDTALTGAAIVPAENLIAAINTLPKDKTLYHCYYDLEKRENYRQYDGLLTPVHGVIHFDFDSKDDDGLLAWEHTKNFCKSLQESGTDFVVYFSGNKGFHVAVHMNDLEIASGTKVEVEGKVKHLMKTIKASYPTLDAGIWNANRKFRAYNSLHEKSGLYKIRLTSIGYNLKAMTIDDIRNEAKKRQAVKYVLPKPGRLATGILELAKVMPLESAPTVQSAPTNLPFRNYTDKLCIKSILSGTLYPQFNRHDIEILLCAEFRQQGLSLDQAWAKLSPWATNAYPQEPQRVQDLLRQLSDIYTKDFNDNKLYQYGCYGDIKKAYCTSKCKIYNTLDKKQRAEPLDCNKAQKLENEVRRNPSLEMSEGMLADKIMKDMPMLCKSNGQYFQWVTTHWKRIDGDMFEDSLVKVAMNMYGNQATIKKNKALAEHVIAKIPIAPESNNFFSSCPNKFNFTDCTAIVTQVGKELKLETLPHNPNDYLAYCAPFPLFGEHNLPKGTEFSKYLETRLNDVGEEGVRIIKQMLGAALIPYVPRIFFIEGVTNSGKSTLAKLIMRLLGNENVSQVLPLLKGGGADRFNWEPSIGKLANIVLELPKGAELDVNTLKMVRDKAKISVDRKKEKHVNATLPFFHIYCCNQMPASFEGNSGALNNRVSMLFFKPGYLNGSGDVVEYADHIWNDDAASVLGAAREGLEDLMASGFRYFNSNESAKMTREWQKMTDNITLYFEEVNSEEWRGPALEGIEWEKGSVIYSDFKDWCHESGRRPMGKQHFYRELETRLQVPRKKNAKGGERFKVDLVLKNALKTRFSGNPNQNPSQISY